MSITVHASFVVGRVKFSSPQIMRELGLLARETIRRRTMRGLDESGRPFQPYSATYAKQKGKELGKSSPVDLTVSGGMLNALQIVDVTDNSVTLGFP